MMVNISRAFNFNFVDSEYLFNQIADKRVESWVFMKDPCVLFGIAAAYLTVVLRILPNYMKNRAAFNINHILRAYNLVQISACGYLIYGISTSGWTTSYTFGCQPVDYSEGPMARNMLNYVYWTFILKVVELLETVFFVLRKKESQVTKLHLYHHVSTMGYAWIGAKYFGGGMPTLSILINSTVHVIMYSYYFLSSYGLKTQAKLQKYKKYVTRIQMVQFWIIFLHGLQALSPNCPISNIAAVIFLPNMLLLFAMFFNFYSNSYATKKNDKLKQP